VPRDVFAAGVRGRVALILGLALSGACRSQPGSGSCSVPQGWGPVQVQTGRHWPLPSAANVRAVRTNATSWRFELPPDTGMATAFIDLDENSALDKLREPSAPCFHQQRGTWECKLRSERIVVHRIDEQDDNGSGSAMLVLAEVRDPASGYLVEDLRLCSSSSAMCADEQSSELVPAAYRDVPKGLKVLPFCQTPKAGSRIRLALRRPPHQLTAFNREVEFEVPGPLGMRAELKRDGARNVFVKASTTKSIERALVWVSKAPHAASDRVGQPLPTAKLPTDAPPVLWNSEQNAGMTVTESEVRATIPHEVLAACGGPCVVRLQLASATSNGTVTIVSESSRTFIVDG
jgi:hypothetical protein